MTTKAKINPTDEKYILPNFMSPVRGRREKPAGKVKIPTYEELPKVKGMFRNAEMPGTGVSFTCRFWKGTPITFHLFDGREYEIAEVVANHLNENCSYKQMKWITPDGVISTGKPITIGGSGFQGIGKDFTKEVSNKNYRFMFQITGKA